MFRYGHRLFFLGFKQACCFSSLANTVQEVTIPVPWGHAAGKWWGDTSIQPVVGLHGWEENANSFDTLVPLLNIPSFLALEQMGAGKSSYYPMGTTHHFVDTVVLLRRVIDHFKWSKTSFIGHSFGSASAFLYAALYPDEVDKYVSIDCARTLMMPTKESWLEETRETLDKTLAIEKQITSEDPPAYPYEELVNRVHVGGNRSATPESVAVLLRRGMETSTQDNSKYYLSRDPRVKLRWLGRMQEEYIMACASKIACQVLSIRGRQGFLFGGKIEQVYLDSVRLLKHHEHHDVEGSHHVHLNNPENVAPLINKFFSR